ncbi:response regulator transcription factor [Halanaerobiaceae bacterium Z-7014]|uniref:Stage 0 sporulation protein A homolog n=1 Tax=Halonatronomonas betaini TaxID=2778430 RepID=A0A931FA44_9FIRM|nr:response regulator transcription factor [Halonatronomonas betaini]
MAERILAVDDEENIRELLKYNLEKEDYQVILASRGDQVFDILDKEDIDLIILDLMLPGIDGLSLCKEIKSDDKFNRLPIIMLTARTEEIDRVVGLEMGADDYVSKPFSMRELIARVKAVLRRTREFQGTVQEAEIISSGKLSINLTSHQAIFDDKVIELTPKEYELIKLLLQNPERFFTRDNLLNKIWGYDYYGDTRTVDVHIRRIRKKISPEIIKTIRGVGYKFVALE